MSNTDYRSPAHSNSRLHILIAILIAVPISYYLVGSLDYFSYMADQVSTRMGGGINTIIFYVLLIFSVFFIILLPRLNQITILSIVIIAFAFITRSKALFSIPILREWHGGQVDMGGLAVLGPPFAVYLILRFKSDLMPALRSSTGIPLLCLTFSCFITQLFYFSLIKAIFLTYFYVGIFALWYFITNIVVMNKDDISSIIKCLVYAVGIASILDLFTTDRDILIDPRIASQLLFKEVGGRQLTSLVFGADNIYVPVLSSTLCLIPAVFLRQRLSGRLLSALTFLIIMRELILTGTRGGLLGLLLLVPLIAYRYKRSITSVLIIALATIALVFFAVQSQFLVQARLSLDGILSAATLRYEINLAALKSLFDFPQFIFGYGARTVDTWTPSAHSAHQEFLWVWVTSGLFGLISFVVFLYNLFQKGFSAVKGETKADDKYLFMCLVCALGCWLIAFLTTGGWFPGYECPEPYIILAVQAALIVAASNSQTTKSSMNST